MIGVYVCVAAAFAALESSANAQGTVDPPVIPQASVALRTLPSNAFTSGPVRPDARQLTQLLMPRDLYLAAIERAVATGFGQVRGDFEALEREHPGLFEALKSEMAKVTRDHEEGALPVTYDRYARAIGSHFTPSDIAGLADFYGSRLGQKIIVGKFAGMDVGSLVAKFAEDSEAELTVQDIGALNSSAVPKILEGFDQADRDALLAFMRTPLFGRLAAFTRTMTALETQIATEPDPELDAKMEKAVDDVMSRFGVGEETS